MGQLPLRNRVAIVKPRWPMGKNSGNDNGVCRSLGAVVCFG